MLSMSQSPCSVLLILVTSLFVQQAHTMPARDEMRIPLVPSIREKFKREAVASPAYNRSTLSSLFGNGSSKRRFCLTRLRDALHIVCSSGSLNNMPIYFNPNQYTYNSNGTITFSGGQASNLRNDIPTMVRPQNDRILRRRSRRNIVRECCEKPCSYSNMRKYCSPTLRLPENYDSINKNQPVYSLSPSPPQQCVSVDDLQSYYLKFFRKQWKKDAFQLQQHGQIPEPEPGEIVNIRKQLKESSSTSPASQQRPDEETRDDNEISKMTEKAVRSSSQSGNVRTLPPINHIVNLPRGTNDYIY